MSYTVAVVVDPDFGQQLSALADRVHTWICASAQNRLAATAYREAHPAPSLDQGVTTFTLVAEETPEEALLGVLGDVDLHHGRYSHAPAWQTLEVYGARLTPRVREALLEFGDGTSDPIAGGFRWSRLGNGAA